MSWVFLHVPNMIKLQFCPLGLKWKVLLGWVKDLLFDSLAICGLPKSLCDVDQSQRLHQDLQRQLAP